MRMRESAGCRERERAREIGRRKETLFPISIVVCVVLFRVVGLSVSLSVLAPAFLVLSQHGLVMLMRVSASVPIRTGSEPPLPCLEREAGRLVE